MTAEVAAVLDELRALRADLHAGRAELRAIRAAVELMASRSAQPVRTLKPADREKLAELLPLVFAAWQTSSWAVRDLWKAPLDGSLRLVAHLGTHSTAKALQIGRLLCRGQGVPVDGLVVRRSKRTSDGLVWAVGRNDDA